MYFMGSQSKKQKEKTEPESDKIKKVPLTDITKGSYTYDKKGTHKNKREETTRAYNHATSKNRHVKNLEAYYLEGKNRKPYTTSEHVVPNNILVAGAPRTAKGFSELKKVNDNFESYGMEVGNINIENSALAYQENGVLHSAHVGTATPKFKEDPKNPRSPKLEEAINNFLAYENETNTNSIYLDTMTKLLHNGQISEAIQLNQLCYAHNPLFREHRDERRGSRHAQEWATNVAADNSFFCSIRDIKKINFVSNAAWDRNKKEYIEKPNISSIEIDAYDKLEAAISRAAGVMGRYPTFAELKDLVRIYKFDTPGELSWLQKKVLDSDHRPIYEPK